MRIYLILQTLYGGGDIAFAQRCIQTAPVKDIRYDFISAGKTGRDHRSMILAANQLDTHTMIISAINDKIGRAHV